MSHHNLDFTSLIHKRGFRVTPQRQLILEAICESGGHSTPEDIYQRLQAKSSAINQATVYRTLDFLCDLRLVVAVQIGRQMFYEIAGKEPHHHLICRKCDKVEQVGHEVTKSFFARIEREQNFVVDMDHLTLFGLCSKCCRAKRVA